MIVSPFFAHSKCAIHWLSYLFILSIFLFAYRIAHGETLDQAKGKAFLNEGQRQVMLKNYYEAQPKLEAAKRIFSEGGAISYQIEAMHLLDRVYDMTIQQDLREKNIKSCISLADRNLAPGSSLIFQSQLMMIDYYLESGRSEKARELLEPLFPALITYGDSLNLSRYYLLSGRCYQKQWEFSLSNEAYRKALDIAVGNPTENRQQIVQVLFRLISFSIETSQLDKAGEYLDQLSDQIGSLSDMSAQDSMNLGNCFFLRGRREWSACNYGKMLEYFEQSLLLYRQISIAHREDLGTALSWIAGAHGWLGKRELGFKAFNEAKHYLQSPTNKEMALTYHNGLIMNLYLKGFDDLREIELGLQKAYELEKKWSLNPFLAYNLASLARTISGKPKEGLKYAKMCLASFDKEGVWELPCKVNRGYARRAVGDAFQAIQKYDSAAYYFHWIIQDFSTDFYAEDWAENPDETNSFSNSRVLDMINSKAFCFERLAEDQKGRRKEFLKMAYQSYQNASRVSEKLRIIYTSTESKLSLAKRTKVTQQGLVSSAYKLFEMTNDTAYLIEAFKTSERARGLLLLESQSDAFARKRGIVPDSILKKEQYLKGELAFYQSALLDKNTYGESRDSNHIAFLKANVYAFLQKLEKWQDSIFVVYPGYAQNSSHQNMITPAQVRDSLLGPREALVEYFIGDTDLFIFLISKEGFKVFRTPISEDFEMKVGIFIETISNLKYVQDSVQEGYVKYTSTAHWLFEYLLGPVLNCGFEFDQLILVRDHILSKIPFEALLMSNASTQIDYLSLPYLLRKHPVRYGHSAKLLFELKKVDFYDANLNCLAMAPGYNSSGVSRGELTSLRSSGGQLEGAQKEVAALSEIGVKGDFFFGVSATERRFKDLASGYKLLHLAMHGKSDKDEPLKSGLIFTEIAEDSTEDHILQAIELESIPLDAKLVVLSACESGIGKFADGEGELSLGRDFMANGANAVIMTLWRVEDKASSTLMQSFYKELTSGTPTGMALHNAKLDFLKSADSRSAHPYFWAGYISMGNSAVLFQSHNIGNTVGLCGLMVLCLLAGGRWVIIKRKARINTI